MPSPALHILHELVRQPSGTVSRVRPLTETDFSSRRFEVQRIVGFSLLDEKTSYKVSWVDTLVHITDVSDFTLGTIDGRPLCDSVDHIRPSTLDENHLYVVWKDSWIPTSWTECAALTREFWSRFRGAKEARAIRLDAFTVNLVGNWSTWAWVCNASGIYIEEKCTMMQARDLNPA